MRTGLREVGPAATGVLVVLADHPLVSPATIGKIINAHGECPGDIVIPLYQGRRGHPTLFPRPVIGEIAASRTLREVISAHAGSVRTIDVDDEGVVLDLDTSADYERMKGRLS